MATRALSICNVVSSPSSFLPRNRLRDLLQLRRAANASGDAVDTEPISNGAWWGDCASSPVPEAAKARLTHSSCRTRHSRLMDAHLASVRAYVFEVAP